MGVLHEALVAVIGRHPTGPGCTNLTNWEQECTHRGLIEPQVEGETSAQRRSRYRDFRKAKSDLLAARWIAIQTDTVIDLKERWQ